MKKQERSVNSKCDFLTLNSVNKTKTHLYHKISNLIFFLEIPEKKNGIRDKKEAKKQLVKVADLIVSTIFTTISFSSLDFLSVKAVALYGN